MLGLCRFYPKKHHLPWALTETRSHGHFLDIPVWISGQKMKTTLMKGIIPRSRSWSGPGTEGIQNTWQDPIPQTYFIPLYPWSIYACCTQMREMFPQPCTPVCYDVVLSTTARSAGLFFWCWLYFFFFFLIKKMLFNLYPAIPQTSKEIGRNQCWGALKGHNIQIQNTT